MTRGYQISIELQGSPWNVPINLTHWGHHFADSIWPSFKEKLHVLIHISLKFAPKGPIDNTSGLVQIMAWHLKGDKLLHEETITWTKSKSLIHIHVTRPQWVNCQSSKSSCEVLSHNPFHPLLPITHCTLWGVTVISNMHGGWYCEYSSKHYPGINARGSHWCQVKLVQKMTWCPEATIYYLIQCWPRSLMPYGTTRSQSGNIVRSRYDILAHGLAPIYVLIYAKTKHT